MTAKVMSADTVAMASAVDVELATCECCGLREECTPAYIALVRERHGGRWICGLCSEAVKDEVSRSGRRISAEEALNRHASFCESFRSSPPPAASAEHLIAAMRHLLRRSLDSPRALRSTPGTPRRADDAEPRPRHLARSGSCFPTLAG